MKIRKIGRERPILYRGEFEIPQKVISRLAVAKNHLNLAQIASFNGKVDQFYLTIDNILSAINVAKEGNLTTTDHQVKIEKFFKYLRRRAKIRSIDKSDFKEFYDLWQKSRYKLHFPKSSKVQKMGLFVSHFFDFAVTEIARLFKSDETILADKINELIKIYQSETILEEVDHFHVFKEMEAERLGEMYGSKLGMKLANPWNFIDISLLTDKKAIVDIIDQSKATREILIDFLTIWDKLVSETRRRILSRVALDIAKAKMKKRNISRNAAVKKAMEAAAKHPEVWKFRLVLNFVFDSSEPKEITSRFSQMLRSLEDMRESPHKSIKTGWEHFKEYSKSL